MADERRGRRAANVTSERNRDRVLEAALARVCGRTPDRVPPCPDPEELAGYIERRLAPEDRKRVEAHLAACLSCQAEVALVVRSAPPVDVRPSPASTAWWRTRWLAWAAPAAAAATLVLAVWVASRPAPSPPATDLGPQARADLTPEAGPPPAAASTPDRPAATSAGPTPRVPADATAARRSDRQAAGSPAPAPGQAERGAQESGGAAGERGLAAGAPKPGESAPAARFSPELPDAPRTLAATPLERPAAGTSAARPVAASPPGSEGSSAAPPGREPAPRPAEAAGAAAAADAARTREEAAGAKRVARAPSGHVAEPDAVAHGPGAQPARAAALAREQAAGLRAGGGATRRFASPSGRVVWEITAAGALRRSVDGGVRWGQPQAGDPRLVAGTAVSDTEAWAIGREGVVWRTSDGATWTPVSRPAAVDLVSIVATSGNEAAVTTAEGRTFHTTDGGRTWRER